MYPIGAGRVKGEMAVTLGGDERRHDEVPPTSEVTRLLSQHLRAVNLDWDHPDLPPALKEAVPLRVRIVPE